MEKLYKIDLTLQPTTLDLWHVGLAGTVLVLALILIILLLVMVISLARSKKKVEPVIEKSEPEIEVVEKIIEVERIVEIEKIVQAPAPEPVILKEATPDAALQLLGLLQKEARFIDFIREDIAAYNDEEVGIAARVVHEGCLKVVDEHFTLSKLRRESEGTQITLQEGFDAASVRLTGNIVGNAPFTGELIHQGWRVNEIRLPKLTAGYDAKIIAAAEVEL